MSIAVLCNRISATATYIYSVRRRRSDDTARRDGGGLTYVLMSSQTIGKQGEDLAAAYLVKRGYAIIQRNYRIRGGEIDLVARKGDEIIFVEVKVRSGVRYGYPEESVTPQKARYITRAITAFIRKHRIPDSFYLRFDIIAVSGSGHEGEQSLHHIENVELPTWGQR